MSNQTFAAGSDIFRTKSTHNEVQTSGRTMGNPNSHHVHSMESASSFSRDTTAGTHLKRPVPETTQPSMAIVSPSDQLKVHDITNILTSSVPSWELQNQGSFEIDDVVEDGPSFDSIFKYPITGDETNNPGALVAGRNNNGVASARNTNLQTSQASLESRNQSFEGVQQHQWGMGRLQRVSTGNNGNIQSFNVSATQQFQKQQSSSRDEAPTFDSRTMSFDTSQGGARLGCASFQSVEEGYDDRGQPAPFVVQHHNIYSGVGDNAGYSMGQGNLQQGGLLWNGGNQNSHVQHHGVQRSATWAPGNPQQQDDGRSSQMLLRPCLTSDSLGFQAPLPADFAPPPSTNKRRRIASYDEIEPFHNRAKHSGSNLGGVFSWTKEDDIRLTEIMKKHKKPLTREWEIIADELAIGRSAKECHDRWIRYVKPGARKGQWTDQEDAIVMEAVITSSEQPFTRWTDLAQQLPGRVGKQIRDRWVNHLNPKINHLPFTRDDDMLLWEAHKQLGKRWVDISVKFFDSTRSENRIKNRWYSASFKKFIAYEMGPDAYTRGNKETVKSEVENSETN